ncbi:MAG: hypothetical protein P4L87_26060 [Formivibrio sp.]|nr:hypothetical protein [Formivibrio sp.]
MNIELNLKSIQAQWVLGLIPADDLPDIAAKAVSAGIESKSLIELAGLNGSDTDETRKLFEQALNELGFGSMRKIDALRHYARFISAAILNSELAPLEGAKRIWQASRRSTLPDFHDLDAFIYAASELEDRPQDRVLFEKAILAEAARWGTPEA